MNAFTHVSFLRKTIGFLLGFLIVFSSSSLSPFLVWGEPLVEVDVTQNTLGSWYFDTVTPTATTHFELDDTAPQGNGAIFIETGALARGDWRNNDGAGKMLSSIQSIAYSTYSDPNNTVGRAPFLALKVQLVLPPQNLNARTLAPINETDENQTEEDATTEEVMPNLDSESSETEEETESLIIPEAEALESGIVGYIVYDPAVQGSPLSSGWSDWDATNDSSGWYWVANPGDAWIPWPDGSLGLLSFNEIKNKFPDSYVDVSDGTLSLISGLYWEEAARVGLDKLIIDAGEDAHILFDFEPDMRIAGRKINDLNFDGVIDPDEPGIPDWEIALYQAPHAPWKTDGNNIPLATTTTCGGALSCPAGLPIGSYWFTNIPNGVYQVFEENRPHWFQTYPGLTEDNGLTIPAQEGGNVLPMTLVAAPVSDPSAPPSTPAEKWLYTKLTQNPTMREIFECAFSLVVGGIDPCAGHRDTLKALRYYSVYLEDGNQIEKADFANVKSGTISGKKYYDSDEDGSLSESEDGLADWTIKLYAFPNAPWRMAPDNTAASTTITDEEGNYTFIDLFPGVYQVFEVQQDDFIQTGPATSTIAGVLSDEGSVILPETLIPAPVTDVTPPSDPAYKWLLAKIAKNWTMQFLLGCAFGSTDTDCAKRPELSNLHYYSAYVDPDSHIQNAHFGNIEKPEDEPETLTNRVASVPDEPVDQTDQNNDGQGGSEIGGAPVVITQSLVNNLLGTTNPPPAGELPQDEGNNTPPATENNLIAFRTTPPSQIFAGGNEDEGGDVIPPPASGESTSTVSGVIPNDTNEEENNNGQLAGLFGLPDIAWKIIWPILLLVLLVGAVRFLARRKGL